MSAKKNVNAGTVVNGRIAYSGLTDAQRGALLAEALKNDPASIATMAALVVSDEAVSDDHAVFLKMVRPYVLGLSTGGRGGQDITVYRPIRRGGTPQNLDAWLAGLSGGACNTDPETVVYVRDVNGDEVTVVTGEDEDGNEVHTPLVDVRGDKNETGDVRIRCADGSVFTPEDGRRVSLRDVNGDVEKWHSIREFSRDGGNTWADVKWTLTLPRPRKK